jgi:hypothetical protein
LSKRLTELISTSSIILAGRAQYVVLQLNANLQVGIINVYAYNDSKKRTRLWEAITKANLPQAQWIIGGDFNSVETLDDRIGSASTTGMSTRETQAWNGLLLKYRVADSFSMTEFRRLTKKRFSWDNG